MISDYLGDCFCVYGRLGKNCQWWGWLVIGFADFIDYEMVFVNLFYFCGAQAAEVVRNFNHAFGEVFIKKVWLIPHIKYQT